VPAAARHHPRPHPGQARCAANIRTLVADSGILATAHAEFQRNHVQDAYSIRCSPQVTGAVRDTADYATTVANRELAAAIDNPVVTLDGRVVSNGNFHGAPIAYVLDFLAIAVADLASISERRTDRFLDVARNRGLNAFLADDPGVDSGHMIAQYTQAGIVSELKRNATPASVDSIPSSAMQEDHVSMGWSAGRKLRRSIDGLARVLAIEILAAVWIGDHLSSESSEADGGLAPNHGTLHIALDPAAFADLLGRFKQLQGNETITRWQAWAHEGNLPDLFAELMSRHYDPQYSRSLGRNFSHWDKRHTVQADDLSDAGIARLAETVRGLFEG